jgi:predicted nicotinamide N-methyase
MTPDAADPIAFIRANLPLSPVPSILEIRLHKAQPTSGLSRLGYSDPPYWAHYWGGGLALARHILDRPESVAGRSVLDLGAGSGLVAIAAALAGAAAVTAVEIDRHAIVALSLNLQANGVTATIVQADILDGPMPDADLILVGDLFYDAVLAKRVTAFLDRCLTVGIEAMVGDPYRAFLPRERLRLLADYPVAETGNVTKSAGVFQFRGLRTGESEMVNP